MSRAGPRCPHCKTATVGAQPDENPHFPFCSKRCKMADLGHWFSEDYRVSRPATEADQADEAENT